MNLNSKNEEMWWLKMLEWSMHNNSEHQNWEDDGSKCQIEDMALNTKPWKDDGSNCQIKDMAHA